MTDETIELLSCPFCGHRAYIRDVNGPKAIMCTSCGANIPARNETVDAQLVAAWNRRHSDAAPGEEELLEALQEALPVLEYVVRNGWDEAPPWGWPHDENYALDVVRAALDNARALRGSDES